MPILHPAQPLGASFPTAGCSSRSPRGRHPGRGPADRPQPPTHPMLRTVQQRPPGLRTPRSSVRALSPSPGAPGCPPRSTARSEAPSPPFHPRAPCRGRAAPHGARTATGPAEPPGRRPAPPRSRLPPLPSRCRCRFRAVARPRPLPLGRRRCGCSRRRALRERRGAERSGAASPPRAILGAPGAGPRLPGWRRSGPPCPALPGPARHGPSARGAAGGSPGPRVGSQLGAGSGPRAVAGTPQPGPGGVTEEFVEFLPRTALNIRVLHKIGAAYGACRARCTACYFQVCFRSLSGLSSALKLVHELHLWLPR